VNDAFEPIPVDRHCARQYLELGVEFDVWLRATTAEAMALQRPLPDGRLKIVAIGARQDGAGYDS